jgi:hypothetical protein
MGALRCLLHGVRRGEVLLEFDVHGMHVRVWEATVPAVQLLLVCAWLCLRVVCICVLVCVYVCVRFCVHACACLYVYSRVCLCAVHTCVCIFV